MGKMRSIFAVFLCGIILSSCSWARELKIFTKEVERAPLSLEQPAASPMTKLKWVVVTEENAEEVFAELKKNGVDPVLFGLTDDNYEILSMNLAQVRKYIILNNSIIKQYKDYYEGKKDGRDSTTQ